MSVSERISEVVEIMRCRQVHHVTDIWRRRGSAKPFCWFKVLRAAASLEVSVHNHAVGGMVGPWLEDQTTSGVHGTNASNGLYIYVETCVVAEEKVYRDMIFAFGIDLLPAERMSCDAKHKYFGLFIDLIVFRVVDGGIQGLWHAVGFSQDRTRIVQRG